MGGLLAAGETGHAHASSGYEEGKGEDGLLLYRWPASDDGKGEQEDDAESYKYGFGVEGDRVGAASILPSVCVFAVILEPAAPDIKGFEAEEDATEDEDVAGEVEGLGGEADVSYVV